MSHLPKPISLLEVFVDSTSTGSVFYGDAPGPAFTVDNYTCPTGVQRLPKTLVGVQTVRNNTGWNSVMPGHVLSSVDDAGDDGKYVTAVEKDYVLLNDVLSITPLGFTLVFTPPDVTATNGIPIVKNTGKIFISDHLNRYLDTPLKFVVDTGVTATMRLRYA